MGYLKSVGTVIIYIGLFLAVITFIPGLPPVAEFSEYSIKFPGEVENHIELQNRLQGAERLFLGELKGAEYFDSYKGEIYTGVQGGYVVKLDGNRIVPIAKFGKKCDGIWQEHKCGRPLGLKFDKNGDLFVCDTYYGIFIVDINTKQYKNIVNMSEPINGKAPHICNALDVADNGDIYWTESSTEFPLYDGTYTFLANPSGRLVRYNVATKKNEVLLENLGFANGVKLSDDESFVIVLETLTSRIIKYNLKGPKAGQKEIFAEGLPGLPDNVHTDDQGGFLVSLIVYADPLHPVLPQSLIPHPLLRKMFARLLYLMELPFQLLQDVYPNEYAERIMHSIGSFEATKVLDVMKTSIVLRMDAQGKILDAIYSDDKNVHDISSSYIHNGYLWLGSPYNEYIMRIPLKQAFPELAGTEMFSSNAKKSEQQNAESRLSETRKGNIKVDVKPVKATTVKPNVEETTEKPILKTATAKPTQRSTQKVNQAPTQAPTQASSQPSTQKPAKTPTHKPTQIPTQKQTRAPVEKPITSTTQKPPVSTTSKPKSAPSPTTAQTATTTTSRSSTTTTTPKPMTTATPPPLPKKAAGEMKKDNPKPSNVKVNTKLPDVKTETPRKVNNVNSKPAESVKQNNRDTQSEKLESTGKKDIPKKT